MNRDELKPLWEAFKDDACQQNYWSEEQIQQLFAPVSHSFPWLLNFGMTLFLIGITGC